MKAPSTPGDREPGNGDAGDGSAADEPGTPGAPGPAEPPASLEPEYRCDLCGAPMEEWHCRIICTFCGYQRDCSDP